MIRWTSPIFLLLVSFSYSQPLVHKEPHHIPVFENKLVRALDVRAKPGDTTQYHIHENDIAFFTVQGSRIWLQELNSKSREVDLPTGWAGSNITHSSDPFIHRFANLGENNFQLIAVEVLSKKFSGRQFSGFGKTLHEDERFSIQEVEVEVIISEVPSILIELSKTGKIEALTYIKPLKRMQKQGKNKSTKFIFIQVK